MKIDKITPCVCIDHKPTLSDSVYYGMPQMKVSGGGKSLRFTPYCPNCGRGGCSEHKSAYLALKYWNELMDRLWVNEDSGDTLDNL